MNKELLKSLALRFIRGFISGAITCMVVVPPLTDLTLEAGKLYILALISAAITGGLMSIDKLIRYNNK